jgi:type II secretory pathway component PulF
LGWGVALRTTFAFRAATGTGAITSGTVEAGSSDDARVLLSDRGLFPLQISPSHGFARSPSGAAIRDLAVGLRILATLLGSGLPLPRCLDALDGLAPASWRRAVPELRKEVGRGASLASALRSSSLEFPPIVFGLVEAGEAGSGLPRAIDEVASLLDTAAERRQAIQSALTYPIVLALASAASIAFLVGVVLPRFAEVLQTLGQHLPRNAELLLATADVIRSGFWPALVTLVAALLVWRGWISKPEGRQRWERVLLSVPLIGGVRLASGTSRFCAALGALLENGIPIARALAPAAEAAGNTEMARRIKEARTEIIAGSSVASAFEKFDAATETAILMIRAGEHAGQLAPMLRHASILEARRVERLIADAVKILEPALILVFGILVAVVAATLMQAVYQARPIS